MTINDTKENLKNKINDNKENLRQKKVVICHKWASDGLKSQDLWEQSSRELRNEEKHYILEW